MCLFLLITEKSMSMENFIKIKKNINIQVLFNVLCTYFIQFPIFFIFADISIPLQPSA